MVSHLICLSIELLPPAKHCSRHWKYSSEQSIDILVRKTDKNQTSRKKCSRDSGGPRIGIELSDPLSQSAAYPRRGLSQAWGHASQPDPSPPSVSSGSLVVQ